MRNRDRWPHEAARLPSSVTTPINSAVASRSSPEAPAPDPSMPRIMRSRSGVLQAGSGHTSARTVTRRASGKRTHPMASARNGLRITHGASRPRPSGPPSERPGLTATPPGRHRVGPNAARTRKLDLQDPAQYVGRALDHAAVIERTPEKCEVGRSLPADVRGKVNRRGGHP